VRNKIINSNFGAADFYISCANTEENHSSLGLQVSCASVPKIVQAQFMGNFELWTVTITTMATRIFVLNYFVAS